METSDLLGRLIDGKYRAESYLGGGSFSEVYRVTGAGGPAAMKVMSKQATGRLDEAIEDFKNEFALLKNLTHPHVGRILDFGYDRDLRIYYFTSELIEGRDLYQTTEGAGVEQVTELFAQVFRAFNYLHSYRVFHHDVKAANILVSKTGQAKVIDFGLSAIDTRGEMIGTPSYMAPEIIAGERPDGRADLYSLGVLFYYCLARSNPFRGQGVPETLRRQQTVIPPPVSRIRPDVPSYFEKILERLLEKNPANRYQRADEVLRDLNRTSPDRFPLETRQTLLSYIPEEGRLIGRREPMEGFRGCFDRVFSPSSPETLLFILVVGERGVGKSRLVKECKYEAQLKGVRTVAAKATDRASLADWLSDFRGPKVPEVFFLDDLDGLGDDSLGPLCARLACLIHSDPEDHPPLLFMGTTQTWESLPGPLRAVLETAGESKVILKLGALSSDEVREYVVTLTGLDQPPESLVSDLVSRTEGNLLLITELIRSLIEGGALFDSAGRWKKTTFEDLSVDFSKAHPTDLLDQILVERIGRLSDPHREVVEALSVVEGGLRLREIGDFAGLSDPYPLIAEMVRGDLLLREGPEGRYRLKNRTLGEVVYRRLSRERRELLHDKAALHFPAGSEERLNHEIRGTDHRNAYRLCRETGDQYLRQARGREAADRFDRALRLLPTLPLLKEGKGRLHDEIDLHLKTGEAHLISLHYEEALKALGRVDEILAGLENSGTAEVRVDTLIRMGAVLLKMGEIEKARLSFSKALSLLKHLKEDRVRELVVENFEGAIHFQQGRLREARAIFEETGRIWKDRLSEEEKKKVTNNDLGMVLLALGETEKAIRRLSQDLEFCARLGDELLTARIHYNLGEACLGTKDYASAIAHYEETVRASLDLKNRELLLRAYNGLGNAGHLAGRVEEAIGYYERALDVSERTGDLKSQAAILANLGILEASRGRLEEGRRHLEPAVALLKSLQGHLAIDWQILVRALLEEGEIARRQGKWEDAERLLEEALSHVDRHPEIESLRPWILKAMEELKTGGEMNDPYASIRALESRLEEMSSRLERYESLSQVSLRAIETRYPYDAIVTRSKGMQEILKLLDKITDTDLPVFIHGESGTGKELIARALHVNSSRSKKRFVAINCGAIPIPLIESELFGYKAGAFTGASHDKRGLFEEAEGGTLFLDEVAEIDPALQAKLLRVTQEGEFYRLGDTRAIRADVRIVSASNRDLERLVKEGRFREDLFYRICSIRIDLPPLRERPEDIPLLAGHFIRRESGKEMRVSTRLLKAFLEYGWPGNIRELENLIRVAVALSEKGVIDARSIPSHHGLARFLAGMPGRSTPRGPSSHAAAGPSLPLIDRQNRYDPNKGWYDYEKVIVAKAYQACGFRAREAARMLGLAPATLYKKVKEIGLTGEGHPLYDDPFSYEKGQRLKDYLKPIFQAALTYSGNRPYSAIPLLKVSQGFFYKVMKGRG